MSYTENQLPLIHPVLPLGGAERGSFGGAERGSLIARDLHRLQVASEARSRDIVWVHLSAYVERMQNMREQILDIVENSRSVKALHTGLCDLISQEIQRAADGNLTAMEYVQKQMAKQQVYVFVGTHWMPMRMQQFYDFVKDAAYRCGLDSNYAEDPRFMGLLYEYLEFRLARDHKQVVPNGEVWINLQNVTLVVGGDGEVMPREHEREDFFNYVLPYCYEPEAECPQWHAFLDQVLPEKNAQVLLGEHIAHCFTKNLKLERMLVLYGGGANGKSVTTDVIIELLGRTNVSHVDLEKLTTDDNHRAQAVGKLANISQENGPNVQYSVLKNMISGEPVMVKNLYKDPYPTTDYGKIIASYNTLPKPEQTHGNFRRWDILHYAVTIAEEERDVHLKDKLCQELPGILNWVLECLRGLITRNMFTSSENCRVALQNYIHDSNSALRFFDEMCVVDTDGRVTAAELFNAYKQFCQDEGVCNKYGKIGFLKQLGQVGVMQQRTNSARYLNVKFKSTF